ncbi:MAG: hypothetical protein ABJN84_12390 [Flavobacteriaceae bacterium]
MKKVVFAFAFMIASVSGFSKNNEQPTVKSNDLETCTVTTSREINSGDGNVYNVSVTSTAETCFEAWSQNQGQIDEFISGVTPA